MKVSASKFCRTLEAAAHGGTMDAINDVVTVILTIMKWAGMSSQLPEGVATGEFGGTLFVPGGTVVSEYS